LAAIGWWGIFKGFVYGVDNLLKAIIHGNADFF